MNDLNSGAGGSVTVGETGSAGGMDTDEIIDFDELIKLIESDEKIYVFNFKDFIDKFNQKCADLVNYIEKHDLFKVPAFDINTKFNPNKIKARITKMNTVVIDIKTTQIEVLTRLNKVNEKYSTIKKLLKNNQVDNEKLKALDDNQIKRVYTLLSAATSKATILSKELLILRQLHLVTTLLHFNKTLVYTLNGYNILITADSSFTINKDLETYMSTKRTSDINEITKLLQ